MAWIVGQNMPGYTPETEPYAHDSFTAARDDLITRLVEHGDQDMQVETEPADLARVWNEYRTARGELRRARARDLIPGDGMTVYAGRLAYWIHHDPTVSANEYNRENVEGCDA